MTAIKKIWDKFADICDVFGAMGDDTVAVKPDTRVRSVVLCRCGNCKLSQLVDMMTSRRNCAGCGHVVTINHDRVGNYEVIS
jgi:dUTPase